MYFLAKFSLLYPTFGKYISTAIPKVPNQPKVWTALLSAAGIKPGNGSILDRHMARMAKIHLASGTVPEIFPTELTNNECAAFAPGLPQKILINKKILELYENDSPNGKADRYMLALVLHEFVHYLDYHRDGELQDETNVSGHSSSSIKDRGDIFEEKAYGGIVPFWK